MCSVLSSPEDPEVLHTTLNHSPFDVARNWIVTIAALKLTDRSKAAMHLGHQTIGLSPAGHVKGKAEQSGDSN